ncbi:MAG: hypothetical protein RBU25_06345 [Lentisphaeria bacterium]|jgi:hypothetical protein|nr:hypothetical protein [Lentisphaeria bacterium]
MRAFRRLLFIATLAASLSGFANTFVRVESERGYQLNETLWKTEWGSYLKAREDIRRIAVKVRNNTDRARTYIIEWYFLAKNPLDRELSVSCWGRVEKKLGPTEEVTYHIVSDRIVGIDENYQALGERYYTGGEFNGYLVTVREGDKFIRKEGSKLASSQFVKKAMGLARQVNPDMPKE